MREGKRRGGGGSESPPAYIIQQFEQQGELWAINGGRSGAGRGGRRSGDYSEGGKCQQEEAGVDKRSKNATYLVGD